MDPDSSTSAPRKVRFAPKAPARRATKTVQPQPENANDGADDEARKAVLLRRVDEHLGRRGPKGEKKSAVRVAFSHEAASTSIRTFGKPREENDERSNRSNIEDSAEQVVVSSASTGRADVEESESSSNRVIASSKKTKKVYREPWDYHHTYYPTVLPLRQPYSGDPEILDEEEFVETTADLDYDENAINSALELGLLEEKKTVQMLFLQLPTNLPIDKQHIEKGKEKVGSSMSSEHARVPASGKGTDWGSKKGRGLEALPAGYMGKMLVYKSGAVKLKLGDNLYDVSPGSDCIFAQDLAVINTVDKDCCRIGELGKRAVVTPDIHSLLDNLNDLG